MISGDHHLVSLQEYERIQILTPSEGCELIARYHLEQLERKHRQGYEQHPVAADEFSVWETEQAWGDE
jgi:hypothetical protein